MTLNDVVVPIEILTYSDEEGTVNGHTVTRGRYPTIHDACIALTVPYAQRAGAPILTHAVDTIGAHLEYWLLVHPDGQATPASAGTYQSPLSRPRPPENTPAAAVPPGPVPEQKRSATSAVSTGLAPLPVLAPLPPMAPFPAMPAMPADLADLFVAAPAVEREPGVVDDDPHGLAVTQTLAHAPAPNADQSGAPDSLDGERRGAERQGAEHEVAEHEEADRSGSTSGAAARALDPNSAREVAATGAQQGATGNGPLADPVVPPRPPLTRAARRHAAETDEPGPVVTPVAVTPIAVGPAPVVPEVSTPVPVAPVAVTPPPVAPPTVTPPPVTPPPVTPPPVAPIAVTPIAEMSLPLMTHTTPPPHPAVPTRQPLDPLLVTPPTPAAPVAPATAGPTPPTPARVPAPAASLLVQADGPAWVAFAEPGADPSAPSPTLDDLLATRPSPPDGPAQLGWRANVRRLTGGLITLRPGGFEVGQRQAIAAVQRSLTGPKTVVVINPKGGASKTTATLLLAATFGIHRGGYTLAWDNNETRGTMGWRALQGRHTNTAVDLLRELDRFEDARSARVGDLDNFVRSQGSAQFDVLASDEDAASAASVDATAFNALHSSLSRFYRVIVVDTGNNMRASNWDAAVAAADQVVIVSTIREDTGQSAAWVADALNEKGHAEKVAAAVTILAAPGPRPDPALATRLQDHFGRLTRGVVRVPFDPSLVSGGPIDIDALSSSSRDAWLEATALVADGL